VGENPWRIGDGVDVLRSPSALRRRFDQWWGVRVGQGRSHEERVRKLAEIGKYLERSDAVEGALDQLSQKLFGQLVEMIESQLTVALLEVLEQPIALKVEREFKRGSVSIAFHVERGGEREDIMRGQGGSVANVLSVGLRLLALTTLDSRQHRRFLVLDEQDCWLKPDLVPRLVRIVYTAGRALGFQVLLISHHDSSAFDAYAEKMYRLVPTADGVSVREVNRRAEVEDGE
jgi:hypothetical protein